MSVPPSYLAKVLQALVRGGILRSTRGLHGGFELADDPSAVNLLDVVNAVSPIRRIDSCPLDLENHSSQLCPLHKRLDHAMSLVEMAFRSTTLAEIIAEPSECPTLGHRFDAAADDTAAQGHA
jgi:Rrf2 family protein